jgi:hypothetical protein
MRSCALKLLCILKIIAELRTTVAFSRYCSLGQPIKRIERASLPLCISHCCRKRGIFTDRRCTESGMDGSRSQVHKKPTNTSEWADKLTREATSRLPSAFLPSRRDILLGFTVALIFLPDMKDHRAPLAAPMPPKFPPDLVVHPCLHS